MLKINIEIGIELIKILTFTSAAVSIAKIIFFRKITRTQTAIISQNPDYSES
jgi:hypothetical protein